MTARWMHPVVILATLALLAGAAGCDDRADSPADVDTAAEDTAAEDTAAEDTAAEDAAAEDAAPEPGGSATPSPVEADDGTRTVEVYVGHADRGDPCEDVFALEREVSAGAPLRGALEALLAGPTPTEADAGYGGWFTAETAGMLNGVRIEDGTAHVDFADFSDVIPNASTSCGSALLLGQLDTTVTQFDTVDDARYAFNGDSDAFYEWLQLAAPE